MKHRKFSKRCRKGRPRKRYVKAILFTIVAVLAAVGGYFYYTNTNYGMEKEYLFIRRNASYDDFRDSIKSSGIRHKEMFIALADMMGMEKKLTPGRYKLSGRMTNYDILKNIAAGKQEPVNIVIAGNIRTREKLAAILSRKLDADSTDFLNTLYNDSFSDSLGFGSQTIIGMYLPNTYSVLWTITPKAFAKRMKKEYEDFWNNDRKKKAEKLGLTPVEVITLASIVAEESNMQSEQSRIAGVYLNRLHKGIPLQADPTIKFALNDPSIKRILYTHLRVDSPYNTYQHPGLPPGPIVIPPLTVIDAVLNAEEHNFIYFCAKPELNGYHNFAATWWEHEQNAKAYQRAISERR